MVTFALWWLFIGAVVWMLLDAIGITRASRHSKTGLVLATAFVIVAWPGFAWKLAAHPCWTVRAIKQNLWGRR